MTKVRFRLAKPCDAKQIANVHWHVRDRYTEGIFLSLGKMFLKAYYEIILNDPWEVVICAEKEDGKIIGFSSLTINANASAKFLRKHKIPLGLSALWGLLVHPGLLKGVIQRYKSLGDKKAPQFIHTDGARVDYLCWLKGDADSNGMLAMEKIKYGIMYDLGLRECFFEVDKHNKRLYTFYTREKSIELLMEYELPDGRTRGLFKKNINK